MRRSVCWTRVRLKTPFAQEATSDLSIGNRTAHFCTPAFALLGPLLFHFPASCSERTPASVLLRRPSHAAMSTGQDIPSTASSGPVTESVPAAAMGGAISRPATAATGNVATVASQTPTSRAPAAVSSAPPPSTTAMAARGAPVDEEEEAAYLGSRYWLPSIIDEATLQDLEAVGYLPTREDCQWRSALGDVIPAPKAGERVILTSHLVRGMALPPSAFFSEVLDHYGLQPHNIAPNSI